MDINSWRVIVMVIGLFLFLGIVAWAWSRKNQRGFDEAAQLPFRDAAHEMGDNLKDRPSAGSSAT